MDLRNYLSTLLKNWLVITICALLGLAAGVAWYLVTPRTYASSVDFYVSTPVTASNNPQSSGQFAESRVNSYILLMSSEQLATRIIDSTGVQLSPQEVAQRIEATSELNTVVVTARVTDTSRERALQIAEGIAQAFPRLVDELDNSRRASDIVVINTIADPRVGSDPVAPNRTLYLGGGLAAGLLLGLAIAVLRELLDTSVRSGEQALRLVRAPVLGTINFDPAAPRAPLIVGDEAMSRRAEAFRQLRTNLQFVDAARAANVILVTSAVPQEGKSSTAVNLALTFVEFGDRVLLIDGDLRRPRTNEYLDLAGDVGLTNILAAQVDASESIQQWGDGGLSFLASGSLPPNPSELLGSARMRDLIEELRGSYDKIVIDSPPVLPVTDAAVTSQLADAVLFVIKSGKTTRAQVANAATALDNVGARVVGSVLNMVRLTRAEQHRYGQDDYYGIAASAPAMGPVRPASWDDDLTSHASPATVDRKH